MDDFKPAIKEMMDGLLLSRLGVKGGKMFGYPAYKVNGKAFAFVGGEGIAIKLPEQRVQALVASGAPFAPFEPVPGQVWREWVSIDHPDDPAGYQQHDALYDESIAFVLSK
jgi:hypothetical protein